MRLLYATDQRHLRVTAPLFALPRLRCATVIAALGFLAALIAPGAAGAAASGGGAAMHMSAQAEAKTLVIRKISCLKGCRSINPTNAGATLRFQGPLLSRGKRVVYLGAEGEADDVKAKLRLVKSGKSVMVTALVPKRAKSGPVAIELDDDARSDASASEIGVPEALAPLPGNGPFFPIRGDYSYGTGAGVFGPASGRTHQGYDVFAKCGTPMVAAEGGAVLYKTYHSRAGHYVVIDVEGADHDAVYMHLRSPALVNRGDKVKAGQQIGEVGDSGRASGCHLHFELWTGGTWQGVGGKAGKPIDPRPTLEQWARLDKTLKAAPKKKAASKKKR